MLFLRETSAGMDGQARLSTLKLILHQHYTSFARNTTTISIPERHVREGAPVLAHFLFSCILE